MPRLFLVGLVIATGACEAIPRPIGQSLGLARYCQDVCK
jgi:hypothetical protein